MSEWCRRLCCRIAVAGGCVALVLSAPGLVFGASPLFAEAAARPEPDCSPRLPEGFRVSAASPAAASIEISRAAFGCAHELGLAFADDPGAISAVASQGIEGPLLLLGSGFSAALVSEIERLAPKRIVAAGIDEALLRYTLPAREVEQLPDAEGDDHRPEEASGRPVWIVGDDGLAAPLAAVARQIGVEVVAATGDLRALPPAARDAISGAAVVEVLADLDEDAVWQLDVVRRGTELPGGGLMLFGPDAANPGRRMVAAYGHPSTSALGVLGEQGPEAAADRLLGIAAGYGADGLAVLPAFEVIATVASAFAGADGDYSSETPKDVIRPWIEAAASRGVYVVLDLQPGRSGFLAQAKMYEEFLAMPHVGLALDPEWRLKPHQKHLAQIGTVDAAEINEVSDWLAGIVRRHSLPQKLLVVHQFRHSMITNRGQIDTPLELAVVIHMDGQGSLGAKYSTWNTLTAPDDAARYFWGWKNFYDEDFPTASPPQVLGLSPTPVFVSFQ